MSSLDHLVAAENRAFVAAVKKYSPTLADWAQKRLSDGFTLNQVKDAIASQMKKAQEVAP